jgi:hypothetical protein
MQNNIGPKINIGFEENFTLFNMIDNTKNMKNLINEKKSTKKKNQRSESRFGRAHYTKNLYVEELVLVLVRAILSIVRMGVPLAWPAWPGKQAGHLASLPP